jgi:hypothetical protein
MAAVPMSFAVDQELQAEFAAAARSRQRAAEDVLSDLMRDYVAQREAVDSASLVSGAEREARVKAVAFARASVGLEGFKPSEKAEARARQYINGEIDLDAFANDPRGIRS